MRANRPETNHLARSRSTGLLLAVLAACAAPAWTGERGADSDSEKDPPPMLADLDNLAQLKKSFNEASGSARLLLLFSPT